MDQAIENFIAITRSDAATARRYLGLTENNPEQAILLFFDSPDLAGAQAAEPSAPPVPSSTRPQRQETNTGDEDLIGFSDREDNMDVDDEDEDESSRAAGVARRAEVEDDEAMARRMQEELYSGGDANGGFDADGVRAPIGRTTETLVGGHEGGWQQDDMHEAVLQQMRARNRPAGSSCKCFE